MSEVLDYKTQELIALGVAYAINCIKCMKVHRNEAVKAGLSAEAMNAALSVAESVVSGARSVTKQEVKTIFGSEVIDGRCCPTGSECCEQEN
jgi:AhpD family alkylhydroperoxidase